jgi:tRNA A-37 threonylcarbamoyl transferase component Bud32
MSSTTCFATLIADRMLPQRDLLLDPDFVASLFSQKLGVSGPIVMDGCEHLRTTYHAGESLRVAYKVSAGGRSCVVAGRAFPQGGSRKRFEQEKPRVADCGPFRPVFHHAETDSIFWTFPNDRKIANLPLLVDIPQELAALFPSRWSRSSVMAYAPENCATVQCLSAQNDLLAYAKVYADDHSQTCFRTYTALRQSAETERAQIYFPEVICHSGQHHILVLQALHGRRMADIQGRELFGAFARLGQALGWLHSLPVPAHLSEFPRFTNSHMQLAASSIGLVRPDLAEQAAELCESLCAQKKELNEPSVCLHGDVHPKNGILLEKGIALIDLDQASVGPPAADLGSLLAALCYERHIGLLTETAERTLADTFLAGYQQISMLPDPESLRWHMAAALFAERAFRSVSRIRLPGLQCLPELLMDTQRILTGSDR